MNDGPLSFEDFETLWRPFKSVAGARIAVAVSGGPDSMALAWLLSRFGRVIAITVDHGLRKDSAAEAKQVGVWLSHIPNLEHHILTRATVDLNDSRIQEDARHDRYRMMSEFCKGQQINTLCVAHHREDQAETFLFRLAKGSGIDGLSAMQDIQNMEQLKLLRPLLGVSKQRLIATCEANSLSYVKDPSNENDKFARVRLRQSMDVLRGEGLTPKRLSVTAARISRARDALDYYAQSFFENGKNQIETDRIRIDLEGFRKLPAEISLRVMGICWRYILADDYGYGPRMEKLEDLHHRVLFENGFKSATLGGCLVKCDGVKKLIVVELEQKNATLN